VFHQTWRQLGIERSRIYQLIGPDPIAAERRTANHNVEPENVQSLHIAQLTNVEQPARPQLPAPDREQSATGASDQPTEQTAVVQPTAVSIAAIAEAQDQPVPPRSTIRRGARPILDLVLHADPRPAAPGRAGDGRCRGDRADGGARAGGSGSGLSRADI